MKAPRPRRLTRARLLSIPHPGVHARLRRAGWALEYASLARGPVGRVRQIRAAGAFDAVILQRRCCPGWQLALLRRSARYLLFDFDRRGPLSRLLRPPRPSSRAGSPGFHQDRPRADVVIAGNDFLADCALPAGARPERVRVIPTCVDPVCTRRRRARAGDGLDLVWIARRARMHGARAAKGLWERMAREVSGLRMRVVCDRFPDLGAMPSSRCRGRRRTEAAALAGGDAGVTWVPDDVWTGASAG